MGSRGGPAGADTDAPQLGRQILGDFWGCAADTLQSLPRLKRILRRAARAGSASVVQEVYHRYLPQGISGILVIAESHLLLHTWPEYQYAALDLLTCGLLLNATPMLESLRQDLGAQDVRVRRIIRGPKPREIVSPSRRGVKS